MGAPKRVSVLLCFALFVVKAAQASVCVELALSGARDKLSAFGPKPVAFKTVYSDDSLRDLRYKQPSYIEVGSEVQYRAIIGAPSQDIDFTKESFLFVFLGERPSGGYGIRISKIERMSEGECQGHVFIHYNERKPAPNQFTTQALTYPYTVVKVAIKEFQVPRSRIHMIYNTPSLPGSALPAGETNDISSESTAPVTTDTPSKSVADTKLPPVSTANPAPAAKPQPILKSMSP